MVERAMPSKFECQVDRRKRLSDTTMYRTSYIKSLKTNIDQKIQAAAAMPVTNTQKGDKTMPEIISM